MNSGLIREAKQLLAGKMGRLDDEETEYLAQEITKLGFKLGFARAYASGPALIEQLVHELERQEAQLRDVRAALGLK